MKITTSTFGEGGLFPVRTIRLDNGVSVQTPTAVHQPGKRWDHHEGFPESRGIAELYRSVKGADIEEAMNGSTGGALNKELEKQDRKTSTDELNIVITEYKETTTLPAVHARYLVDVQAQYSDILAVPLMPQLIRTIDDGTNDPSYQSLKTSIEQFLDVAAEVHPDLPVMGLIPRLGWKHIQDLLTVYGRQDIRAYLFDFDRCRVTAGNQVSMVSPVMKHIARRGIEDNVLLYAVNPGPGQENPELGGRPAADMPALGIGFDVLGGRSRRPRLPREVFDQPKEETESPAKFRMFDRSEWLYRDVPVTELEQYFPERTEFDLEFVATKARGSDGTKSRIQHAFNSEQRALAAQELRTQVTEGYSAQHFLREKRGITESDETAFGKVREEFNAGRFQTGLGDF